MAIKKNENGRWVADVQPGGRGAKRLQKTFDTKAEANHWVIHVSSQRQKTPDWIPADRDRRTLQNLIDEWHSQHGQSLKDGKRTKRKLDLLCEGIKNPLAVDFTASTFLEYRERRLTTVSKNTVNHELAYLKAVFNHHIKINNWRLPNPVENITPVKFLKTTVRYLTKEEITKLLTALNAARNIDAQPITLLCLSTGARWAEIEEITTTQLNAESINIGTKSGKMRTVPLAPELMKMLKDRKPDENGRLFDSAAGAFRSAVKRAKLNLPAGQLTHICRHTFASHFIMAGGNILVLQKILGHESLTMTLRYAHLAPDHLEEATRLNPVTQFNLSITNQ